MNPRPEVQVFSQQDDPLEGGLSELVSLSGLKLNTIRKLRALGVLTSSRGQYRKSDRLFFESPSKEQIMALLVRDDQITSWTFMSPKWLQVMQESRPALPNDELLYWYYHDLYDYPERCKECGAALKTFLSFAIGYKAGWCSLRCKGKSSEIKDRVKNTVASRYGVVNVSQVEAVKTKVRNTVLERFGEHPLSSKVRQKHLLTKYGVDHPSKIPGVQQRRAITTRKLLLKRAKQSGFEACDAALDAQKADVLKWRCVEHDRVFSTTLSSIWLGCRKCRPARQSRPELQISAFLDGLGVKYETRNRKVLQGYELDFYFPEHRLAVEFHGIYWHSTKRLGDNQYHQKKHLAAREAGIKLIQIFEDEYVQNHELVHSIIRSNLGLCQRVYARKLTVGDVPPKEASSFLLANHLQGPDRASIRIGLYDGDKLLALMTFGRPRFSKHADWELIRFCSRRDMAVVGAFSKLLKRRPVGSIITYADARLGIGNVYSTNGFVETHLTPVDYFYVHPKEMKRVNRLACQKHKLPNLLEKFDPELTEVQNMEANGWFRIFGAGHYAFLLDHVGSS
jgi:very-short-patch-repair endonuclease